MGLVVERASDVAGALETVLSDLRVAERFPAARAAFNGRRDSGRRPAIDVPDAFSPLMGFDDGGSKAIAAARKKLAGSSEGLLTPDSAKAA